MSRALRKKIESSSNSESGSSIYIFVIGGRTRLKFLDIELLMRPPYIPSTVDNFPVWMISLHIPLSRKI